MTCTSSTPQYAYISCLHSFRSLTYFSTVSKTGWMMWPYMLTGLSTGCRIILYDGSPFYPDVKYFLKFLSDEGCVFLVRARNT